MYTVALTPEQHEALCRCRDTSPKPYQRERAAALLKIAAGASATAVARRGLLRPRRPETVYQWVQRFVAHGVAGLLTIRPGRGRKPAFSPLPSPAVLPAPTPGPAPSPATEAAAAQAARKAAEQQAQERFLHLLRRDPRLCGAPRTRWTLAELAPACDFLAPITVQGLSQLLRRVGIHYKAARDHVHSPDPDYEAKLTYIDQLVATARASEGRLVLLYHDELTYYRQPSLARAYEARGRHQPLAQRSHAANTATRVAATLDGFTGRVVPWQGTRFDIPQVVRFFQQVRAAYPEAECIYVVQDNWPVHFHPDVLVALEPQTQPWPLYRDRKSVV